MGQWLWQKCAGLTQVEMQQGFDTQSILRKLADKDRDLQSANFQLSQLSQTANIVGTLRPFPQPAYITASPYQSVSNYCGYGYGGCGCGC